MQYVDPIKENPKNIKVHGNPMRQLVYIAPKNKPFTRKNIEKNVDRLNTELAKKGFKGQMAVYLWYEDEQKWFSKKFTDVGEPIKLFSFEEEYDVPELDPETHSKVIIQFTKYNKDEGGCSS